MNIGLMDNHLIVAPHESKPDAASLKASRFKRFASQGNRYLFMNQMAGFGVATTASRAMLQTSKAVTNGNVYGVKVLHYAP